MWFVVCGFLHAVVTLDGALIELDGRMIGGGLGLGGCSIRTDGLQGTASLAVSLNTDTDPKRMQQLQQSIKQLQAQIHEHKHKRVCI